MNERRNMQRTRTLRTGKILFHQRGSVIDCVVRNLSAQGACLQVESIVDVPDSFDLVIEGDASRPCRLAWKRGNRIGVEFGAERAEPHRVKEAATS